ncbi:MAG: hypothetical protein UY04_C0025G0008 [Parcubacteria group bacterium GW2011_GWA2_47_7]|nr:MAG: hypothetical protein UY04_C0025G0008 [Parcubacteria group bacterium GW2011_GWA2_47_7]
MATISKEDIIDAIDELNENRLDMLTEYWQFLIAEEGGTEAKPLVDASVACANMLYSAKAYQDTLDWLDAIGLEIAKTYGEESEQYVEFIESDDLENLRMNALDKSSIEDDEDEDFGEDE